MYQSRTVHTIVMNLLHSSIVDMRTKGLNQELKLRCFECVIKAESLYRRTEELVSLTLTSASDLCGTYPQWDGC